MQKNACAALATALLLGSFSIPSLASGTEQLASFLKGTHSASGSFSQVTADRKGKTGQAMSGVFKFQRPGKFVWNYEKPYEQGIYCNGRTISVWDPDLRQVTVKAIASSMPSSPAAILFGNNDFRRDFTVKDAGTKDGLEWIDAVPKLHDTSFTDIRIGFRDGLPAAMTLKDSFGQTITLHMSDMKKNPSISSSAFEFRPRKGRKFSVSKSAVFHENPRNILIIKES